MTEVSDCSVCAEKFTASVRTKITCNYCSYNACKTCVTRYLLSQVVDAHCMNCRTGWNCEFLDTNLSKSFVKGAWRDHKKKMYLNREKAFLPNFQKFAAAKKRMEELEPLRTKVAQKYLNIENIKAALLQKITTNNRILANNNVKPTDELYIKHQEDISKLPDVFNKHTQRYIKNMSCINEWQEQWNIYQGVDSNKNVEKKVFIMKCVKEGCRGFLSQAYKCELCLTYVCKDCMLVKNEKNDETHVCKKEDVDSVALIRKETHPCPKCGIRISKIDGCDMMWCTAADCGTAFSWISGKIISGVIHNPHYYEWQRRNNNGVAPRNPGDVPCGANDLPTYNYIYTTFRNLGIRMNIQTAPFYNQITQILNIHRSLLDIQEYRIALYTTTRDPMMFKENHVEFLLGNITEEKWVQAIFMKELNIEKKQAVLAVLQTVLAAGTDLFRGFTPILDSLLIEKRYAVTPEDFKPIDDIVIQLETLRNYINESLVSTGENVSTPVPQFDKSWNCQQAISVGRIKIMNEEAKIKSASATPPPLIPAALPANIVTT